MQHLHIRSYNEGPIFSKAVLKCTWLLEHEHLSRFGKYTGIFLNSISQISDSSIFWGDFADLLDFSASNIWILSRIEGSMFHLHFKMAFEKNMTLMLNPIGRVQFYT